MRKQIKGYGFYLIILAIVILTIFLSDSFENSNHNAYNRARFDKDLEAGKVSYVDIYPNEEIPTGEVRVEFKNGQTRRSFHDSDVKELEELLKAAGVDYARHDISKPNWFFSSVLPYILMFVVVIALLHSYQTRHPWRRNSKVMNFGKSRAKLSSEESRKTTFKNVAGLDEEKDELKEVVDF